MNSRLKVPFRTGLLKIKKRMTKKKIAYILTFSYSCPLSILKIGVYTLFRRPSKEERKKRTERRKLCSGGGGGRRRGGGGEGDEVVEALSAVR